MTPPAPPAPPSVADCTLEIDGRTALLAFDRHDVRNALTGTNIVDDLLAVIGWINRVRTISVLILTGNGTAFSAGGNVRDMRDRAGDFEGSAPDVEHAYRHGIQRMPRAMHDIEVPVIAAVNGPAIGAGCDLACMCDLRIGGRSARFAESFVNLGIIPGDGGAWFLSRAVGMQRAAELTLTGRTVESSEAQALGLLLEVVPDDRLRDRALTLAKTLAAKPPVALRYAKRLLRMAGSVSLDRFLDACAVYQGVAHQTADHREALAAFFEQRPGTYRGH